MTRQALDQLAHFAAALGILALFSLGGVMFGALAGLGMGLIRELSATGGQAGQDYLVTVRVTTNFGQVDERTIRVPVRER